MRVIKLIIPVILISLSLCASYAADNAKVWTLNECIYHAIINNITVKKQELTNKDAAINLQMSKNKRMPIVSGELIQGFSSYPINSTNNNTLSTIGEIGIEMPLFTGFEISNNIAVNKLNLNAEIEHLDAIKDDITINITAQYLQVLYLKEIYDVTGKQLIMTKELNEKDKAYFEQEKISQSVLYDSQARVARDELAVTQAQNDYTLALLDLTQLLELPQLEGFSIAPLNDDDIAIRLLPTAKDVFENALSINHTIKFKEYNIKAAEKNISLARSEYYPSLSINGKIGSLYNNINGNNNGAFGIQLENNFSTYIGLSLKIPIFNGLKSQNRVKKAKIQYNVEQLNFDDSKKSLYKAIQQAYYHAVAANKKYESSIIAANASWKSLELMTEKRNIGKSSILEYNQSMTDWLKVESDRIQAKYESKLRGIILEFYSTGKIQ